MAEDRLIVEVDGYAAHSGRRAFERDRRKDAALQAQGYRVLRLSYRQVMNEPERTVATITTLARRTTSMNRATPPEDIAPTTPRSTYDAPHHRGLTDTHSTPA
jgi:hypothetical protein